MSTEELNNIPLYSKTSFGFSEELPSNHSLEKYVPEVGNQYNSGSCVAWAFSYYGMSTIYNNKYEITTKAGKKANSFDPWFLYNQIAYLNENTCSQGVGEEELLITSKRLGNKKMFYTPRDIDCETDWENLSLKNVVKYTRPYRFTSWEKIDASRDNSVSVVKSEIFNYGYPVMIGIENYGNGLDDISSDGIFKPNYEVTTRDNYDGHMMTIVGYDDNINGGSFRIVNSYGKDWGDNGYMWMSYNDYRKYTETTITVYLSFDQDNNAGTGLNLENYTRFVSKSGYIYEGQTTSDQLSGLAITTINDTYFIGNFISGLKEGYFKVINNEGIFYANFKNDELVEDDELGFAGSEESLIESVSTQKYLNQMFDKVKIKNYKE